MFIPPPALLIIAIAISYLISLQFPTLQYDGLSVSWFGLLLVTLGAAGVVWGSSTLSRFGTTLHPRGKPKKLVTHGPYDYSRKPRYLGVLLITVGTALLFANVLAFVGPLLFFWFATVFIIPFEEDMLTRRFGKPYHAYRKKTRRWL